MNINTISVALGCAGLLAGGLGLLAQDSGRPSAGAGAVQGARAAWPPHALAAGVEFHDEMFELLTLGAKPRARAAPLAQPETAPADADTAVRSIRRVRAGGARRAQVVEIEFVEPDGRTYRRRYQMGRQAYASGDPRGEVEADRSSLESYGYSPRRSRRSGRGNFGWRW